MLQLSALAPGPLMLSSLLLLMLLPLLLVLMHLHLMLLLTWFSPRQQESYKTPGCLQPLLTGLQQGWRFLQRQGWISQQQQRW